LLDRLDYLAIGPRRLPRRHREMGDEGDRSAEQAQDEPDSAAAAFVSPDAASDEPEEQGEACQRAPAESSARRVSVETRYQSPPVAASALATAVSPSINSVASRARQ